MSEKAFRYRKGNGPSFFEKMQGKSRKAAHLFPKSGASFPHSPQRRSRILPLLLLAAFLFSAKAVAQGVTVEARLDSFQIYIGQQTKLRIQVSSPADRKISFPLFPDTLVRGVEMVGNVEYDTLHLDEGKVQQITGTYTITSFDSALYSLPPFPVLVSGTKYQTNPLVLKVYTVPVDTSKPDQFFPLRPLMQAPFAWDDWAHLIGLSLLMLVLLAAASYCFLRYKDNAPIIRKIKRKPSLPPHQEALQEIEEVKQEKLHETGGEEKEYYTKLTDILRTYIHRRFGFNALEMTSSEIISRLMQEEGENGAAFEELKSLFQTADLVKFAKWMPELNENDYNLICAVEFINKTKQEIPPAPEPEPVEVQIERKRSLRARIFLLSIVSLSSLGAISILLYVLHELQLLML